MNANSASGAAPIGGRGRLVIVLLTFVALCAAFFAGAVHQSDAVADPHDAGASVVAGGSPASADSFAAGDNESLQESSGWLSALASACALFVFMLVAIAVWALLVRPKVGLRRPVKDRAPASLAQFDLVATRPSPLLTLSISRT
jgi:hypothetical protein